MDEATYGVKSGEHIPGIVLHRYLTDFAQHFGIYELIRFESMVESVEPGSGDGWRLRVKGVGKKEVDGSEVIETKKLIIATGLTSTPNLPSYEGQETFTEPFFHARDFCKNGTLVETAEKVVIVGGAKSAFDVAYAFAMSPKSPSVDIIIRETGQVSKTLRYLIIQLTILRAQYGFSHPKSHPSSVQEKNSSPLAS